ncbi:MAG: hypothetical protein LQ351_007658 [Letrouitia transgressa]|nr:MAG: hypothetical protein LQ351_007658 [Letrouitia transgressa]
MLISGVISRPLLASTVLALFLIYTFLSNIGIRHQSPRTQTTATLPPANLTESSGIPPNIWEINFGPPLNEDNANSIASWITINPGHSFTLLTNEGGDAFVQSHYGSKPFIRDTYLELTNPILRSDFLRYLILAAAGGIYTDIDVDAIQPFSRWIGDHTKVNAVIGVEYDQRRDPELARGMFLPMQLCQWTIAMNAHHPLIVKMTEAVAQAIHDLANTQGSSVAKVMPEKADVLLTTGPAKWSEVVFQYLSSITHSKVDHRNFTGIKQPRQVGDILILPIDGFATGVPHSGASRRVTANSMIVHRFHGTWKQDPGNEKSPDQKIQSERVPE